VTRHDTSGFYRIQPDAKGYPGMTSLDLGGGKAITCLGFGAQAKAALRKAAARRR
jgi:hypothetical protein